MVQIGQNKLAKLKEATIMTCSVVFIRHAHADEGSYPNDADRPLSKEGRSTQEKMTQFLKNQELSPVMILTSPYKRAVETAEMLSHTFHVDVEIQPALSPDDFDEDFVINRINPPFDQECFFIVGHDPVLVSLARDLAINKDEVPHGISKSAALVMQFDHEINPDTGHVLGYYHPDKVL